MSFSKMVIPMEPAYAGCFLIFSASLIPMILCFVFIIIHALRLSDIRIFYPITRFATMTLAEEYRQSFPHKMQNSTMIHVHSAIDSFV